MESLGCWSLKLLQEKNQGAVIKLVMFYINNNKLIKLHKENMFPPHMPGSDGIRNSQRHHHTYI